MSFTSEAAASVFFLPTAIVVSVGSTSFKILAALAAALAFSVLETSSTCSTHSFTAGKFSFTYSNVCSADFLLVPLSNKSKSSTACFASAGRSS